MAKSTAYAALASLQHKFQAKIREVGQLKKQISEGNNTNVEIQRLRLRNENLVNDLTRTEKALNLSEFTASQAHTAYNRLQAHIRDTDGVLVELRGSVSNWKSLSGVLFVVGLSVGVLSALAYVAQTTPL